MLFHFTSTIVVKNALFDAFIFYLYKKLLSNRKQFCRLMNVTVFKASMRYLLSSRWTSFLSKHHNQMSEKLNKLNQRTVSTVPIHNNMHWWKNKTQNWSFLINVTHVSTYERNVKIICWFNSFNFNKLLRTLFDTFSINGHLLLTYLKLDSS